MRLEQQVQLEELVILDSRDFLVNLEPLDLQEARGPLEAEDQQEIQDSPAAPVQPA